MSSHDDELTRFEVEGAPPLPEPAEHGRVEHNGARIWYATFGYGAPVVLLHGGLGHSGNWGYQVPALVTHGYRVIAIDTRGHGRSTRDERPFGYQLLASDVLAVLDTLGVHTASYVGWNDGAVVALTVAMRAPTRACGVVFFACAMDMGGLKPLDQPLPILSRVYRCHAQDYRRLSPTPDRFEQFSAAVEKMMKSEPNYSAEALRTITTRVFVLRSSDDEFIEPEHADYLVRTIPDARLVELHGVSHFAPWQRPR
ncbi:MAG: alpha/beta hydrolase [Spirochaetales bacterium]|nr:alpha/beta hydrolase [Spirochaetales bacterium]